MHSSPSTAHLRPPPPTLGSQSLASHLYQICWTGQGKDQGQGTGRALPSPACNLSARASASIASSSSHLRAPCSCPVRVHLLLSGVGACASECCGFGSGSAPAMAWPAEHTHIARAVLSCNDPDLRAIAGGRERGTRPARGQRRCSGITPFPFPCPRLLLRLARFPVISISLHRCFFLACLLDARRCRVPFFCAKRGLPRPGARSSERGEGRAWPG